MRLPKLPSFGISIKVLLLLLFVIAAGAGMVVMIITQAQHLRATRSELLRSRQHVAQLQADYQALEEERSRLAADRKELEQMSASLREQLASAMDDLEQSRKGFAGLQEQVGDLVEERDKLKSKIERITSERDEEASRVEQVEAEKTELQRSLRRLRERLALLSRDYNDLAEQVAMLRSRPEHASIDIVSPLGRKVVSSNASAKAVASFEPLSTAGAVELPPIIVRKNQAGMSLPIRGRLVEVNEPHNFIVLNRGSEDGVKVGMVFDILRGNEVVGRVSAVRVRPKLAACDIIRSNTPETLHVGDIAVQRGS